MKETKKQVLKVKGIAVYPKMESGKFKVCIGIDSKAKEKVLKACDLANDTLEPIFMETLEDEPVKGLYALNVKTGFEIPIYNSKGENMVGDEEYPIYHGAKGIFSINIVEYQYKKQIGLTAYLNGAIVIEQGVKGGIDFETLKKDYENDLIQF